MMRVRGDRQALMHPHMLKQDCGCFSFPTSPPGGADGSEENRVWELLENTLNASLSFLKNNF